MNHVNIDAEFALNEGQGSIHTGMEADLHANSLVLLVCCVNSPIPINGSQNMRFAFCKVFHIPCERGRGMKAQALPNALSHRARCEPGPGHGAVATYGWSTQTPHQASCTRDLQMSYP